MRGDQIMQAGQALGAGWTNLAIGEPVFLQNAMGWAFPSGDHCGHLPDLAEGYPDPRGTLALRRALVEWGDSGCCGRDPSRVVVANGATQALAAAVHACRGASGKIGPDFIEVSRNYLVGCPPGPHYPGFGHIVACGGGYFVTKLTVPDATILAYPNNPDGCADGLKLYGREHEGLGPVKIWDAAYAHRQYGFEERHTPIYDVGVGSASKALGASGLRVGWAWFPTDELADLATEYVERSSAGTSAVSQELLTWAVGKVTDQNEQYVRSQAYARESLADTRKLFTDHLAPYVVDESNDGMFAWFRAREPEQFERALAAAEVLLVPGPAFGAPVGYWRMNMGAEWAAVGYGCERLARALEEEAKRGQEGR
jgi:aspartate/methionine/tyrosine aminotransferase